jgi:8-oxo-dGTP pyrophosphatase MutT (NUDIX family)
MEIAKTASKVVYRNRWMTVREDEIVRPSGAKGIYGVVEKPDFAVIAAIEGDRIWLVEQYRYPVGGRYWELPQGTSESGSMDGAGVAAAELREETGLVADSMVHVGHLFAAYGFATQGYDVYVASGLRHSEAQREPEEEGLVAKAFDLRTVEEMLTAGVIKDASTVAAFGLLRLKGFL